MDREGRLIEGRGVNERVTEPLILERVPPGPDFDPLEDPELALEGGLDELTEAEVQELEALAVAEHGTPEEMEIEGGSVHEDEALSQAEEDDE
jgi:nucleotide-binding universal stress UspA family protein